MCRCVIDSLSCWSLSSGVGRTAVFIALHIVLERMQIEGVIDIFQTVKILRIQRPAMVQTLVSEITVNGCGVYHFLLSTSLTTTFIC